MASAPAAPALLPTLFISHGGGPCFHMVARDRSDFIAEIDANSRAAHFFRGLVPSLRLAAPLRAILVVSAHWEAARPTVMTAAAPPMLYDYGGFPPHTYELSWPAPGAPALAARVRALLGEAGLASAEDAQRGFDHGVFVPLMLAFPQADVPCLQLSLASSLDPALHLKLGAALAPLRAEGVLIVGSGFLTHNLRGGFAAPFSPPFAWATAFERSVDAALLEGDVATRAARVAGLEKADAKLFRQAHPREEHFLPIVVAAAAGLAPQRQQQQLQQQEPGAGGGAAAAAVGAGGDAQPAVAPVPAPAPAPVTKIYEQIVNGGGSLACYRFDGGSA
jgi:aromatic ring-opening dioxygenase catalytic subunit (LigB family)